MRRWISLGILLVWATGWLPGQSRQDSLVGRKAPSFQVSGIYGESYSLDLVKGHILVMQFGASW